MWVWFNVCRVDFSVGYVSVCKIVVACSVYSSKHVHLHKIQLLRLKLGFMALKSRAKWAAPQDKPKNQMKVVLWLGVHLHGNI